MAKKRFEFKFEFTFVVPAPNYTKALAVASALMSLIVKCADVIGGEVKHGGFVTDVSAGKRDVKKH